MKFKVQPCSSAMRTTMKTKTKRKATPIVITPQMIREAEAQHPDLVRFAKIMVDVGRVMHDRFGHEAMQLLLKAVGDAEKKYPVSETALTVAKLIEYAKRVRDDYFDERILGNQRGTASLKLLASAVNRL